MGLTRLHEVVDVNYMIPAMQGFSLVGDVATLFAETCMVSARRLPQLWGEVRRDTDPGLRTWLGGHESWKITHWDRVWR